MNKKEVIEIVGEETKRWESETGLVFIYREPSSREIINYKNSIQFRRRGKDFISKSAEQQLALADAILIDAEGLGYRTPEGKVEILDKTTKLADIAHLKVDGQSPRSWKDLIPATRKTQFIESIITGLEESEKN